MKRKQDQPINTSPWNLVTSKRTREINHNDKSNQNTVSDGSLSNVESERIESGLNRNEYHLRSKNPPVVDDDADADVPRNSLKRLQQPPAYINPNLMKIKLESDYVPIVAVKQESSTGDETQEILENDVNNDEEDKKVDTLSFSLDSSKNNIKSEFSATDLEHKMQSALDNKSDIKLNVDELQHLLNVIQSSEEKSKGSKTQQHQEKEKVVVKVEPIKKEIETEKKETEKEIITELEERVNKYTKKIVLLHREKVEIQTTVKNQLEQLNLVRGEHENEVHHLKGTIKQQLEEINRLKSQVNHKPTREPNKEFRLNSQNPDPIASENVNQVKIQDFPTKVLSRIFDFLDIESLKQSRFVCRQWKNEAGKILLLKYYVTNAPVYSSNILKCETVLINWLMSSYATTKAQKLWAQDGQKTAELLKKLPALRCSVRELKYDEKSHTGPHDSENLYEILKLLPKLEVLETSMLTLSPSQNWLGDVTSFSNRNPMKLELFIRKLQTLKKLKLDFDLGKSNTTTFLVHHHRFSRIQSVEIRAGGMPVITSFLRPHVHIWNITDFSVKLSLKYDFNLIRSFLTRISSTLQHLKLIVVQDTIASLSSFVSNLDPWRDDPTWIIPLGLNNLKSLKIVVSGWGFAVPKNLAQLNPFMLKSIIFALGLPALKKLAVAFIPWNLEEIISDWNSSQHFPGGRKLISKSLEELELTSDVFSASSSLSVIASAGRIQTIPVKLWPALKTLKCTWANPEDFDTSILSEFAVSGNLERFHIKIGHGLKQTEDVKNCDNRNPWQFNLSDLKNLKSFCLEAHLNNPRCRNLATSLIESDLKRLKSLQCVQFRGVVVDSGPLKLALGPNIPVIFSK